MWVVECMFRMKLALCFVGLGTPYVATIHLAYDCVKADANRTTLCEEDNSKGFEFKGRLAHLGRRTKLIGVRETA